MKDSVGNFMARCSIFIASGFIKNAWALAEKSFLQKMED